MIKVSSPPYRQGTEATSVEVTLVLNAGGIGDFIHWIGAIRYVIDSNPHIYGQVLSPAHFFPLADLWLSNHSPRFKVIPWEKLEGNPYLTNCISVGPDGKQLANACGFHLTHLGFVYYTQKNKIIPEYATLPVITRFEADISHFTLPRDYAVIATEATAENRMLPAEAVNAISAHLISRGITPVFLGKHHIAGDYKATSANGIRTEGILDLREKTNLIEAATILAGARLVLGVDGGLLHLASCSLTPVIFIFTTVHPSYRLPKRRSGAKTCSIIPPESLSCRFCNSGDPDGTAMSYVIGHDFKNCLYKDNLCTKLIDAKTIINVINEILE